MKKVFIVFSFLTLTACSAKLLLPTQTDVNRVLTKYPGYTWDQLMTGKSIYQHNWKRLKDPSSKSEDQWIELVPRMVRKVNKKAGREVIDRKAEEILLKYLITMSKVPKTK